MPTTTATITHSPTSIPYPSSSPSQIPLKAANGSIGISKSSKSKVATLDALYKRASRAFIHRDFALTYSLIHEAFTQLPPLATLAGVSYPASKHTPNDTATRRKWDILRISLESTFYTSPPAASTLITPGADLRALRALLVESPQTVVTNAWKRSLELFAPFGARPSAEFVPSQILQTLTYASLKTDCPDVGRTIIEEWLTRRSNLSSDVGLGGLESTSHGDDGYEKILELYCLQVLPKLGQWEYAQEFLRYESELKSETRENLQNKLQALYTQHMSSTSNENTPTPSGATSPRPLSPSSSVSSSSSSSSISTTSTHTIVPSTSRTNRSGLNGLTSGALSRSSSRRSSVSDGSTSTVKAKSPLQPLTPDTTNGISSASSSATLRPPLTNRGKPSPNGLIPPANGSATAQRASRSPLRGSHLASSSTPRSASASSNSTTASASRRLPFSHSLASSVTSGPSSHHGEMAGPGVHGTGKLSIYDVVKRVLRPYMNISKRKMIGFVLLLVVLPFLSWVLSVRRRNKRLALGIGAAGAGAITGPGTTNPGLTALRSNAELVKRRLQVQAGSSPGVVGKLWTELVRAVVDTVKMAGSGLV
ncbi:hypothetical protein AX16_005423 [Volvariella volvacea WC 439]|nr:hypothetical protein AX16_005423 [Volvariella volvacea WC 439]